MASEVSVCNVALGRIGIDQFIESLDDPNPRARACANLYSEIRDLVLEDFPWAFAQKVVALAPLSGDPPVGWGAWYGLPSDCVKAQAVVQATTVAAGTWNFGPVWNYNAWPGRLPFRLMSGALLTNIDEAYLWYTAKITDPEQFSALFRSALAWRLAAELALALKANVALAQNAGSAYLAEVSRAQVHSLTQGQDQAQAESPSVTARL